MTIMPGTGGNPAGGKLPSSRHSRLWQAAPPVVAVWLALAALPGLPGPMRAGLDPSWVLGMSMAHTQGLTYGKDIIWTYGPLGYLMFPSPGNAGTDPMYLVLAYKLGIYLLWVLALVRLSFAAASGLRLWVVALVGFAAILDPLGDYLPLAVFAWSLLIVLDRSRWRRVDLAILAFLAALEFMVKINAGVEAGCLFASVLIVVYFQEAPFSRAGKWQIAGVALLLPFFVVLLYTAATGGVASLAAYIRNSLDMAFGYSEAMSLNGPYAQVLLAIVSMAVLFLGLPLVERSIRNLAAAFLPAFVYAFFAFKAGMVRQDGHAANFQLHLALAALFLLVMVRRRLSVYFTLGFQAACLFFSHAYISEAWPGTDTVVVSRLTLHGNFSTLQGFMHWSRTWAGLEQQGRQNLLPLRVRPEFDAAIGGKSVESLPWNVAQVRANGWNWRPRPVFQTYAAYTPALDRINAEHLKTGRAADFTIVTWEDVDGRHPFVDAPFSWQEQLNLYQTVATNSEMLLLGRRSTARFQGIDQLGFETDGWDREIRVPQSPDPMMVSAQIARSFSGRLRSLLFRSNPLFIEVTRRSGKSERYRALRANFADGVIMNELPASLGDLALLASSGCSLSDPVVSFRFQTDRPAEYKSAIMVQWARLVRNPEAAGNCVQITSTDAEFPIWGGIGGVPVSAGDAQTWSATAKEPWVAVPSDGPRTGNTVLPYAVGRNPAPAPRRGEIAINGRAFRIFQPWSRAPRISIQFGFFGPRQPPAEGPPLPAHWDLMVDSFEGFAVPGGGQPVIGDWTGNGLMRVGLFRDGDWFLDLNGNRRWDGEKGGDGAFTFGLPGDIAVPGDWTGNGITKLGVFRKSGEQGAWAFDINGNMAFDRTDRFALFGLATDIPVVGKWSHERADRVGVYQAGTWVVDSNGDGVFQLSDDRFSFGLKGDLPIVSLANSGIGVYRNGNCILDSNGNRRFDTTDLAVPCENKGQKPLIAAW
jgi:hypothetical protein